ncbi:MAG TPA: DUF4291 domain-containing protein [Kofleriaceae bacterium]|nr:DUF4291 domain-containing protein [Kofleriaceae bacterium]
MSTALQLEPYVAQRARWPRTGKHVLAQFDDESVVVYQAYRPSIGRFAAAHGWFGGDFSLGRMSWIKPNFLWMMYRSGWGTKEGQEVVLAVWLRRVAFERILDQAVASSFGASGLADAPTWEQAVARSDVRLQWDPDHDPHGRPQGRRAVQLGLRRAVLADYARPWIVRIEDISPLVAEQREVLRTRGADALVMPREDVYPRLPATGAAPSPPNV